MAGPVNFCSVCFLFFGFAPKYCSMHAQLQSSRTTKTTRLNATFWILSTTPYPFLVLCAGFATARISAPSP